MSRSTLRLARHGFAYRYDQGCRCDECREAKMAKRRAARARARAANSPSYQRELATARALKATYAGTCRECGAATTGCNGPGKAPDLCVRCNGRRTAIALRGSGPVASAALAYLSRPRRRSEIADHLGITPTHVGVLMVRLIRYGLVERVERGVYLRAAA